MNSFNVSAVAFMLLVSHSTLASGCEGKVIVRSSKLGLEIKACPTAAPQGDQEWCDVFVDLRVDAEDARILQTKKFDTLVRRMGDLIQSECPDAYEITVTSESNNIGLVYRGIAVAKDGWRLFQIE